jgi:pimeloyl-ACP methyl ester carboxylesterase
MQKISKFILTKSIGLYINVLSYIYPAKAAQLAYRFFSEPRDGRLNQEQLPEMLKEAEAEMVTHNDMIFQAYTWKGDEKKILLIHGWESNSWRWEQFMPHLKKSGATVVAIDAPAHGLSSGNEFNIPRYAQFVNVMVQRLHPNYIVGHSLGGATALYFLSHYPNNSIEKVVSMGAPSDLNTILYNYRALLSLNEKVMNLMQTHFTKHFNINIHEFSGSLFASKIKVPGLLIHDEDDQIVALKEAEKIARAWPAAKFIVTKGLGHSLHDDNLYQKINHFLFGKEY